MKIQNTIALALIASNFIGGSALANSDLAKKNVCFACHIFDKKLVGPSFKDVAKKYADVPDAASQLAVSIKKGGAGKWGPVPMPPPAGLSDADAKALAIWILDGAK
jgi:cytochrome c